jgi:hypothetical protein
VLRKTPGKYSLAISLARNHQKDGLWRETAVPLPYTLPSQALLVTLDWIKDHMDTAQSLTQKQAQLA